MFGKQQLLIAPPTSNFKILIITGSFQIPFGSPRVVPGLVQYKEVYKVPGLRLAEPNIIGMELLPLVIICYLRVYSILFLPQFLLSLSFIEYTAFLFLRSYNTLSLPQFVHYTFPHLNA